MRIYKSLQGLAANIGGCYESMGITIHQIGRLRANIDGPHQREFGIGIIIDNSTARSQSLLYWLIHTVRARL
jgi:hypothetical protein